MDKKNFSFGLVTGIAVVAVIGFIVMTVMYFNKDDGGSALPKAVENVKGDDQPNSPPPSKEVKVESDDHVRGNPNAPITIVEFSDFECPFCVRFHETMKQIIENYPNDVRWVYKHFPLDSIHKQARPAAEASECAGEQGKYWEYADELNENQRSFSQSYFVTAARDLGLNVSQFEICLESGKYKSKVNDDYNEGVSLGVRGTPGNFINGQSVPGAVPYEQIEAMIENLK